MMLAPTNIAEDKTLRPWSSSPAVSLTRNLPRDIDADILLLGGDVRSILYTAYVEQDARLAALNTPVYNELPPRKLDITWCEPHDFNIVRSVVILTFIYDFDVPHYGQGFWAMYHCAFISEGLYHIAAQCIRRLQPFLTIDAWSSSRYGSLIRFVDQATFDAFRRGVSKILAELGSVPQDTEAYLQTLRRVAARFESQDSDALREALARAAVRSAGPLGIPTQDTILAVYKADWSLSALDKVKSYGLRANPLFKPLADPGASLDTPLPVLGHHLATAFANLAKTSPLRPPTSPTAQNTTLCDQDSLSNKAVQTAASEFETWAAAFKRMEENVVIRFAAADPLAFCQTLQAHSLSSPVTGNWYQRQNDFGTIHFDTPTSSQKDAIPRQFDTIETGSLADNMGCLNVLVSTSPLLKDSASATLFTEVDVQREEGQQYVFENTFLGSASEISLLLGVSPIEYFTNGTVTSNMDELFAKQGDGADRKPIQRVRLRLSWKKSNQIAGKGAGTKRLTAEAEDIAGILSKIYRNMLKDWSGTTPSPSDDGYDNAQLATPPYHAGSLVSLMKAVQGQVDAPWDDACSRFHEMIQQQQSRDVEHVPDFSTEVAALSDIWKVYSHQFPKLPGNTALGSFHAWPHVPEVVVVNLTVPHAQLNKILQQTSTASILMVAVDSHNDDGSSKKDWFGALHYGYGKLETISGTMVPNPGKLQVKSAPEADRDDLIISFFAPSHILHSDPKPTSFALYVHDNKKATANAVDLGELGNEARVVISPWLPNLTAHPRMGALTQISDHEDRDKTNQKQTEVNENSPSITNVTSPLNLPYTTKYTIQTSQQQGKIIGIVAHIDVKSQTGKDLLLVDRCIVTLKQESPFKVRVSFGNSDFSPICAFPTPVWLDKASKPRVARQSSWVEVVVSIANPVTAPPLADYVFPNSITASGNIVSLNIPYINIDFLPILDLDDKERNKFLTTIASMQFSARERVLREEAQASTSTGIMPSVRANFKETLMTMFMLASGVQGGQSGLMALNVEGGQGIHMLFFVSAIRLDGPTSSAVLDAAVVPVTSGMLLDSTFGEFLMALRHFEIATLIVNEDELRLWKSVLPGMVERCRAWPHLEDCEYRKAGQAPVSLAHGDPVLCDCGRGKLPPGFVNDSLPGWSEVGVHCATRIAISPTFAVPLVEDLVSTENLVKIQSARDQRERCANCGATQAKRGGPLKKCTGCFKVQYCSPICQKKDWSKHRPECIKPEDE